MAAATPVRLGALLRRALAEHGDRAAVRDLSSELGYRELLIQAQRFADRLTVLADGLPAGRRPQVLIRARNSPAYVITLLGTWLAGAVPFLLDPTLSEAEQTTLIRACGIDLEFTESSGPAAAITDLVGTRSVGSAAAGRPAVLAETELCRFTSGSSRSPACIEFSGSAVLNAATGWLSASGLAAGERVLCFAGLYNGLAFNTSLVPGLLIGCTLWLPRAQPSAGYVARYLAASEPQVLVGFPALYVGLGRRPDAVTGTAQLRTALSSAARLDPKLAESVYRGHGIAVADYYGIAETGPLTFNDRPRDPGQQGTLNPGVSIRAEAQAPESPRPDGAAELLVRSPSMGTRYLNYPKLLEQRLTDDGYYRTGDLGSLRDGRLWLAGRLVGRFDIGGKKFSPDEVRAALLHHPAISEVYLRELTLQSGETVVGALVEGPADLSDTEVRTHCRELLARYKVPGLICVVPLVPRSGTGKVAAGEATRLLHVAAARNPSSPRQGVTL